MSQASVRRSPARSRRRTTATTRSRSTVRRQQNTRSEGRFWGRALMVTVVLLIVWAHARGQA